MCALVRPRVRVMVVWDGWGGMAKAWAKAKDKAWRQSQSGTQSDHRCSSSISWQYRQTRYGWKCQRHPALVV